MIKKLKTPTIAEIKRADPDDPYDYRRLMDAIETLAINGRICGFRNAIDLPDDLAKLSEHRANAVSSGEDKRSTLNSILDANAN